MKSPPPPPPPPPPPLPPADEELAALEDAELDREEELEAREDVGLLNRLSAFRSDAVPEAELIREPAPVALLLADVLPEEPELALEEDPPD